MYVCGSTPQKTVRLPIERNLFSLQFTTHSLSHFETLFSVFCCFFSVDNFFYFYSFSFIFVLAVIFVFFVFFLFSFRFFLLLIEEQKKKRQRAVCTIYLFRVHHNHKIQRDPAAQKRNETKNCDFK